MSNLTIGWYLNDHEAQSGPFLIEDVLRMIREGSVSRDALAWRDGMAEWSRIAEIAELSMELSPTASHPAIKITTEVAIPDPSSGLQFDHVESVQTGSALACSSCAKLTGPSYFTLNGTILCSSCRDVFAAALQGGSGMKRFSKSLGAGGVAALAGAIVWFFITKITGYELGLVAVFLGIFIGRVVRWGSEGRGGWPYQTLAVILTYLSIVSSYVPLLLMDAPNQKSADRPSAAGSSDTSPIVKATTPAADTLTNPSASSARTDPVPDKNPPSAKKAILALLMFAGIVLVIPFLAGVNNIIGLLIISFALYEAWKVNRKVMLVIEGPFRVSTTSPSGQGFSRSR